MRIGTFNAGVVPEIDAPPRIDSAVKALHIGGNVLRRDANTPDWAVIQGGNVDVKEGARPRPVSHDLLNHGSRVDGRILKVHGGNLLVLQGDRDAGPAAERSFNR